MCLLKENVKMSLMATHFREEQPEATTIIPLKRTFVVVFFSSYERKFTTLQPKQKIPYGRVRRCM